MSLKLRKRGGVYHARGTLPVREAGHVVQRRVERSTKTGDRAQAKTIAREFERQAFERAYSEPGGTQGFAEAALTYMQTTDNMRFMEPLLRHFKEVPLDDIDQAAMMQARATLYPNAKPSTVNRQLFTPVLAILNMASRQGKCAPPRLERPRGHDDKPPLDVPPDDWFPKVLPHCRPQLGALVAFLTLTGCRVSEAMSLKPGDIDLEAGKAHIATSKTGQPVTVPIPAPVLDWLLTDPSWKERARVFGYQSGSNVRRDVTRACEKAGVKRYTTHPFGRHAFATRLLVKEGKSLVFLKEAGHWKTIKMPAERYGHLERREVDREVHEIGSRVGQNWGKLTGQNGK